MAKTDNKTISSPVTFNYDKIKFTITAAITTSLAKMK